MRLICVKAPPPSLAHVPVTLNFLDGGRTVKRNGIFALAFAAVVAVGAVMPALAHPGHGPGQAGPMGPYGPMHMGPDGRMMMQQWGMPMGPGRHMGPGGGHMMMPWGPGPHGPRGMMGWWRQEAAAPDVSVDVVRRFLERRLAWQGYKRLKVGDVKQNKKDKNIIVADIVTKDGALVQRYEVDRRTGLWKALD